jgi:hypothetical protein
MERRPLAKSYMSGLLVRIEIALKNAFQLLYVSALSKFIASIDEGNKCRKMVQMLANVVAVSNLIAS